MQPKPNLEGIESQHSKLMPSLAKPLPDANGEEGDSSHQRRLIQNREKQLASRDWFIKCYQTAIMAYLNSMVRDPVQASEIWEVFLDKFLDGGMSNYDPKLGSFRTYLKTVLWNTRAKYFRDRKQTNRKVQLEASPIVEVQPTNADDEFDRALVESTLVSAVESLREIDLKFYVAIKAATQAINDGGKPPSSAEMSQILSEELETPISVEYARQIKSRGSRLFADQIIEEVSRLIGSSNLDEIEEALIDLKILQFCKLALAKKRGGDS